MLIKSPLISEGSGSLAGNTMSHNRGGLYLRARVTPVNPATLPQEAVRASMARLAADWVTNLSQVQRDAWDLYALNVPLPGPLGDLRNVGGLGMFIRGNLARDQAALVGVKDAPTIFNVGSFTPVVLSAASAALNTLTIDFTNTDEWAGEDLSGLLVYGSRPVNASINYFTGPYRFAGFVAGDAVLPPTSPATITNPFPFAVGNKIFIKVVVSREDGRYSNIQRAGIVAVA